MKRTPEEPEEQPAKLPSPSHPGAPQNSPVTPAKLPSSRRLDEVSHTMTSQPQPIQQRPTRVEPRKIYIDASSDAHRTPRPLEVQAAAQEVGSDLKKTSRNLNNRRQFRDTAAKIPHRCHQHPTHKLPPWVEIYQLPATPWIKIYQQNVYRTIDGKNDLLKYPPIVVERLERWPAYFKKLEEIFGGPINARPYQKGIRFMPKTENEYRAVQRYLTELEKSQKLSWFCYSLPADRTIMIAIRGLAYDTTTDDVIEALVELGYTPLYAEAAATAATTTTTTKPRGSRRGRKTKPKEKRTESEATQKPLMQTATASQIICEAKEVTTSASANVRPRYVQPSTSTSVDVQTPLPTAGTKNYRTKLPEVSVVAAFTGTKAKPETKEPENAGPKGCTWKQWSSSRSLGGGTPATTNPRTQPLSRLAVDPTGSGQFPRSFNITEMQEE
ncbi:hypothetical protein ACJJTC_014587 [Scirpophaga incertulas]